MCLKGGPRCHTHAKGEVEKWQSKHRAQKAIVSALESSVINAEKNISEYDGPEAKEVRKRAVALVQAVKKSTVENVKLSALQYKVDTAIMEAHATIGGIEELKNEIMDAEMKGQSTLEKQKVLEEATNKYYQDLENHDRANGTVDGRKPSPYGYPAGIAELDSRLSKEQDKLQALKDTDIQPSSPKTSAEIEKSQERIDKLRNQIDHAERTNMRHMMGFTMKHSGISKTVPTNHALASKLEYNGPVPKWAKSMEKESREKWGGDDHPRIIDTIDSPIGKLAVVWEPRSLSDNDSHVQGERGFTVNRTSFVDMKTGKKVAYLSSSYIDDDSAKRSFKDDEWSGLAYMEEYSGRSYGLRKYRDIPVEKRIPILGSKRVKKTERFNPLREAKTSEELLAVKRDVWLQSHRSFEQTPLSSKGSRGGKAHYQLSLEDAPNTHAALDADMAPIKKLADKEYANFKKDNDTPFVDFSRTEKIIQGTGLGSALYVYSAKMLGQNGQVLRGSGLQSGEATDVWDRFANNKDLPIRKIMREHSKSKPKEHYALDFRAK